MTDKEGSEQQEAGKISDFDTLMILAIGFVLAILLALALWVYVFNQ